MLIHAAFSIAMLATRHVEYSQFTSFTSKNGGLQNLTKQNVFIKLRITPPFQ